MVSADEFDAEAFLARERPRLRRYLTGMTRDPIEAEDLTQEALVRAWRGLPRLRDPGAARAWLYRIATNVVVERARADSRRSTVVVDPSEPGAGGRTAPATDPLAPLRLEQQEMSGCLNDLTDRLSDSQRAVLLLHDAHGLSNPEIAQLLGCSLPAVKIRLHRARARLTRLVEESCQVGSDDRGIVICEPTPDAVRGLLHGPAGADALDD